MSKKQWERSEKQHKKWREIFRRFLKEKGLDNREGSKGNTNCILCFVWGRDPALYRSWLTCKSKCKFVRVNATAKFKNFDSLLQIWGKSLYNGVECVKINSIRQEIGKKAKNSQRSDCRLLFCKGKSHP